MKESDLKLYFKANTGKLHFFTGEQKMSDIIMAGLWDESIIDNKAKPQILFIKHMKNNPKTSQTMKTQGKV